MYQALYRKYRPKKLEDVVGQDIIIKTLSNSIINNKINHAYLFTGPRGTGKTSIAKIFSKIVNCENLNGIEVCDKCVNCTQINNQQFTDIIEIDAASNNGVDEIREIRNKVNLVPSNGKYKVYIIDEVHMLTPAAFNALLKTLEEPPAHIIFILATTEPHKIPKTILSRCQRFDFKKISINSIVKRLSNIVTKEKIDIENDALNLIANISDGGLRDSIGILDQVTSYTNEKITIKEVHEINGTVGENEIQKLIDYIIKKDIKSIFKVIGEYDSNGKNLLKITDQIIEFLKNLLIYNNCSDYFEDETKKKIYEETLKSIDEKRIYNYINLFLDSFKNNKTTNNSKLMLELTIIKILDDKALKIKQESKQEKTIKQQPVKQKRNNEEEKIIKENIVLSDEVVNNIQKIKDIRINNTLANFNKKQLMEFKTKLDEISYLLINPDYSSYVSLILDGELKALGNNNILFVYKSELLSNYFNSELIILEKIFEEVYNKKFNLISVPIEQWNKIKKEFNDSLKKKINIYKYKEENLNLEELLKPKKEEKNKTNEVTELDDIFGEVIQYN